MLSMDEAAPSTRNSRYPKPLFKTLVFKTVKGLIKLFKKKSQMWKKKTISFIRIEKSPFSR
jgi:hypothetical protein